MSLWIWIVFLLAGLFSFVSAVLDWEWFMTDRKAAVFAGFLGRNGTRVLYALFGVFLIALGLAGVFGLIG
jgi:small neutral amino acid transporter SnatA (MarC family)